MSRVKETVEVLKDLIDCEFWNPEHEKAVLHAIAVLERLNQESIERIMQKQLKYYVDSECPSARILATTLIEEVGK